MSEPLSRAQALRVLALASAADAHDIKRAYRRLARQHHPDLGGDPSVFHELQQAFERLVDDDATPTAPTMSRGRPSRPTPRPADGDGDIDLDSVDWSVASPTPGCRLTRSHMAVAMLDGDAMGVRALAATSRSPGSRLNLIAPHLAGNMTCSLRAFPDADDRGRAMVSIEIRAWNRRSRRVLQQAALVGHWTRIRGSSSILLRTQVAPGTQARSTIVRAVDRTEELLEPLGWGLDAWTLTAQAR